MHKHLVVGLQMFSAMINSGVAKRLGDDRLISNAAFANFLYHLGFVGVCYFDMQDFQKMGIDLGGVYFNAALNGVLAYLNYQAYVDTGSQRDNPLPLNGQNSMVNCIRFNSALAGVFGIWALFSKSTFLDNYFESAPTSGNEAILLGIIVRTFAFNCIGSVLKNGSLVNSGNEDAQYGAVRGAGMYWLLGCGAISQDNFISHWKPDAHVMNVVMQFGLAFYCLSVMLKQDVAKASKRK